jgi:anti-sigma B factor antagonist
VAAGTRWQCTSERRRTVTQHEGPGEPVSESLSITRSDDERGVVLALTGELDVISAPELEMQLNGLAAEACPRVLLDLSGLTFVDSAGVSVLVKAKHEAEADGRRLILRSPTEQVRRVFSVVGLADWLA